MSQNDDPGRYPDSRCMDPEVVRYCEELEAERNEPRSCSLCDAFGHGYPGGGPCPLEERGWMDSFNCPPWAQ